MAAVVVAVVVYGYGSVVVYDSCGGIWIRIRSGGGRWQGDDDGAATA